MLLLYRLMFLLLLKISTRPSLALLFLLLPLALPASPQATIS